MLLLPRINAPSIKQQASIIPATGLPICISRMCVYIYRDKSYITIQGCCVHYITIQGCCVHYITIQGCCVHYITIQGCCVHYITIQGCCVHYITIQGCCVHYITRKRWSVLHCHIGLLHGNFCNILNLSNIYLGKICQKSFLEWLFTNI